MQSASLPLLQVTPLPLNSQAASDKSSNPQLNLSLSPSGTGGCRAAALVVVTGLGVLVGNNNLRSVVDFFVVVRALVDVVRGLVVVDKGLAVVVRAMVDVVRPLVVVVRPLAVVVGPLVVVVRGLVVVDRGLVVVVRALSVVDSAPHSSVGPALSVVAVVLV